jgi:hypothetical protein
MGHESNHDEVLTSNRIDLKMIGVYPSLVLGHSGYVDPDGDKSGGPSSLGNPFWRRRRRTSCDLCDP